MFELFYTTFIAHCCTSYFSLPFIRNINEIGNENRTLDHVTKGLRCPETLGNKVKFPRMFPTQKIPLLTLMLRYFSGLEFACPLGRKIR